MAAHALHLIFIKLAGNFSNLKRTRIHTRIRIRIRICVVVAFAIAKVHTAYTHTHTLAPTYKGWQTYVWVQLPFTIWRCQAQWQGEGRDCNTLASPRAVSVARLRESFVLLWRPRRALSRQHTYVYSRQMRRPCAIAISLALACARARVCLSSAVLCCSGSRVCASQV